MRTKNSKKVDEAFGLADLGVIDEQELERRLDVAGAPIIDGGSIEDAPDEHLATIFATARDGQWQKAYCASLIVGRGLTCGCETCQQIEAYAKRWDAFIEHSPNSAALLWRGRQ